MSAAPTQRLRRLARISAVACFLCIASPLLLPAQEPIPCEKPLGESDVVNLLTADVPEARIRQFVTTCGVDFDLAPEVEKRLRQLGATDGVILALSRAPRPDPAQKILHRAIEAMGGLDALRNLRSRVCVEESVIYLSTSEMKYSSKSSLMFPDKLRFEVNNPFGNQIDILNGDRVWRQTSKGVEELLYAGRYGTGRGFGRTLELRLLGAIEGRYRTELIGSGIVNGQHTDILLLTETEPSWAVEANNPGDPLKIYVERVTGRVVKRSFREGGSEIEAVYSDFRRVGPLVLPFARSSTRDGQRSDESSVQSCEVNVYIDPSLFSLEGRAKQSAASQDALLTGSVFDPNGNAVVGANVRLHNPNTGWSQTAITDASGMFNFPRVPPGDSYVVSVEKAGFATATRPGLALKPGENKLLLAPFELQPAAKPAAVNSFTLQEVLSLLEAGVLPKRVAHLVQERGVGFDLTEELEARLRAAGATDEVLLAIARNRK